MNFAGQYYLAMATPGCIELNQDELICVQRLLEVLLCEHKYSLVLGDFTKGCPKEEKTCQKSHLDLCNKSIVINKVKNLWQSSIFLLFTAVTKNMYANPSQVGSSDSEHRLDPDVANSGPMSIFQQTHSTETHSQKE